MSKFRIVIEDLELKMSLGLHQFEKGQAQRVLVSVEIDVASGDFQSEEFLTMTRSLSL